MLIVASCIRTEAATLSESEARDPARARRRPRRGERTIRSCERVWRITDFAEISNSPQPGANGFRSVHARDRRRANPGNQFRSANSTGRSRRRWRKFRPPVPPHPALSRLIPPFLKHRPATLSILFSRVFAARSSRIGTNPPNRLRLAMQGPAMPGARDRGR